MAQQEADPAAPPADPAFRIVLNIDITTSMASQLEGVKAYCAELATLCQDLEVPVSMAVITFTESGRRCYVSLNEFQDLAAARAFVEGLELGTPPDQPDAFAGGGDEQENQKAALYRMTELDPAVPTISFLITDAGPHFRRRGSRPEAQAELAWLQAKGLDAEVAADAQRVCAKVLDHFNGSLVQHVVHYGRDPLDQAFYGSLAQRTGGMLMQPNLSGSRILSSALLHIIKLLLSQFPGGPPPPAPADESEEDVLPPLDGFWLYDLDELNAVETEEEDLGSVRVGDTATIFKIAMERMLAVCGRRWTKRALGMAAPAEQLTFVYRAARYIATPPSDPSAAGAELAALLELRDKILEALPEEDRGHFSISDQDLRGRLRDWYQRLAAAGGGEGGGEPRSSAISLATVGEALAEDATWEDVLAEVAKLLLGYGLRVQLPLDRDNNPDFADAWSSRLEALGCDTITSADFLRLISDKATAQGLTDREEHNAFLVTASPGDPLASLVLRLASGTQVLNYVTGVCLGAKGFLPNLYPGVAAATLVSLLDQKTLSQFQWQQAQELLHCLSTLHHAPARSLLEGLKAGRANPEDPISKMVAAAARLRGPSAAKGASSFSGSNSKQLQEPLQLILQERLLGMVQRKYGRRDEEGTAEYLRALRTYLPAHLLLAVPAALDPTQQLHPLEKPLAAAAASDLRPGWEATAYQRVSQGAVRGGEKSHRSLPPLSVIQRFERAAQRLVTLLLGPPAGPPPPDSSTSQPAGPSKDTSKEPGPNSKGSSGPAAAEDKPMEEVEEGEVPAPAANTTSASASNIALVPLSSVWPGWQEAVVQALLLRWRTARYTSRQVEEAKGAGSSAAGATKAAAPTTAWTLLEQLPPTGELLLQRLADVHAADIKGWRAARLAAAESALTQAAVKLILQHPTDEQALNAALGQLFLQLTPGAASSERPVDAPRGPLAVLLDQTARLERKAVPALLRGLAAAAPDASFGPAPLVVLITGDWTSMPASALKKAGEVLVAVAAAGRPDLQEALAARDKCARPRGVNKHGHSASLPYPGPDGWSEGYAAARLKMLRGHNGKKKRAELYLVAMKQYTQMAAAAREAAAASGSAAKVAAVEALLRGSDDAHELPAVLAKVEGELGKELALPFQRPAAMPAPQGAAPPPAGPQRAGKRARSAAWAAKGHRDDISPARGAKRAKTATGAAWRGRRY